MVTPIETPRTRVQANPNTQSRPPGDHAHRISPHARVSESRRQAPAPWWSLPANRPTRAYRRFQTPDSDHLVVTPIESAHTRVKVNRLYHHITFSLISWRQTGRRPYIKRLKTLDSNCDASSCPLFPDSHNLLEYLSRRRSSFSLDSTPGLHRQRGPVMLLVRCNRRLFSRRFIRWPKKLVKAVFKQCLQFPL